MHSTLSLADRIDAVLPQTQCTQCGYPDCRRYADAVASGEAAINRCPPGGDEGIVRLAELTGRPPLALDPACGSTKPFMVALIDEAHCIGCTLCIQACPVDAILGAVKQMHTVLADECTGCELCIAPCPVDCIDLVPARRPDALPEREAQADRWRGRHRFHLFRIERERSERTARLAAKALAKRDDPHFAAPDKQARIEAALARSQARLAAAPVAAPEPEPTPPAADAARARQAKLDDIMARAAARLAQAKKG